eukprot:jgi/Chrzof1/10266/Cz04g34240.t1
MAGWAMTSSGHSAGDCGHTSAQQLQHKYIASYKHARAAQSRKESFAQAQEGRVLRLLLNSTKPGPFRISVIYQLDGSNYITHTEKLLLRNRLMPGAVKVLQKFFQIRLPMWQPLLVDKPEDGLCSLAKIDSKLWEGTGVPNTDFVLYVTAKQVPTCAANSTLAYTVSCAYEPLTSRPVLGAINICKWGLRSGGSLDVVTETLVHELIHAMGFDNELFEFFYDATTGSTYKNVPLKNVTDKTGRTTATYITTPKVREYARRYFDCSKLIGAPADIHSSGSHWKQRLMNHELMIPTAAEDEQRSRLTMFTLLLMEDSGWYVANRSAAQELEWGRGAGCSFALRSCQDYMKTAKGQTYFCNKKNSEAADMVTYDNRGLAACQEGADDKCYLSAPYSNQKLLLCQRPSTFKSADDLRFLHSIKSVGGVVGSANSRAYSLIQRPCSVHTAKKGEICPYSWGRDAICLESQCLKNGQLSIVFKVRANKMDKSINASRINAAANLTRSSIIKCPSGSIVDLAAKLPGVFSAGKLQCPNSSIVCPTLGCGPCNNGYCWKGKCQCLLEYVGASCNESLIPKA